MNIKRNLLLFVMALTPATSGFAQEVNTWGDLSAESHQDYVSMLDPFLNMQIPALLNASRDPFGNAVAYNLSTFRYRLRGLDGIYTTTMVNGIQMNDVNNGRMQWGLWGGLNDATRNQTTSIGLSPVEEGLGDLGGVQNLSFRAADYRPGTRLTFSNSNRSYTTRLMVTSSTGLTSSGWAATVSASLRLGRRGYVLGSFYDATGFFLSLQKRLGKDHDLTFVALTAPTVRGVNGGSTQEVYDLVGNNFYNPNVGYQNGKVRNSRVRESNEPIFMLTHDWRISDHTKLTTTAMYRMGYNGYSAMNWMGQDPRPDYYRNLPSFQEVPAVQEAVADAWRSKNPSVLYIDFDRMIRANASNMTVIKNDKGEEVANGHRSLYIIEDRRSDQRQFSFATSLHSDLSSALHLDGGVTFVANRTSNFTTVKDLLGGQYWYDIDKFAERDFADPLKSMVDLNNKYHIAHQGDKFGYDYDTYLFRPEAWLTLKHSSRHFDSYLAAQIGMARIYRDGKMRRGLFPNNSFGRSAVVNFLEYDLKAGTTYKLSGHHYFQANVGVSQRAPYVRNVFMSARTRNSIVDGLTPERAYSLEGSYILRTPYVKARLTTFFNHIDGKTNVINFYDDQYRAFGQYVMTNISEQYVGAEGGLEWKLSPTWSLTAAGAIGDFFYSNNPNYEHYVDNTGKLLDAGIVYWKNFKLPSTPQQVASVGFTYNSPHYWYCGITGNYAGKSFISLNPTLRTIDNVEMKGYDPEKYFGQMTFGDHVTLDAFFGKSWMFQHKYRLALNLNVSNLLNNKSIITGGYEQMRNRYKYVNGEQTFDRPFDKKLFYAYGLTYFANLTFSW